MRAGIVALCAESEQSHMQAWTRHDWPKVRSGHEPGLDPYFLPASGVFMDMGGALSQGAIIARDYSIPAVVNVGLASKIIRNRRPGSGRRELRASNGSEARSQPLKGEVCG